LDFVFALSPVLPLIMDSELLKTQLSDGINASITEMLLDLEKAQASNDNDAIIRAHCELNKQRAEIIIRDILSAVPKLVSREYRGAVYEALSILEQKPVGELKAKKGAWLLSTVRNVIKDIDFKYFLDFAGESESTEPSSTVPNSPVQSA